MPDLSNCMKDRNGNIWCWDMEGEAVLLIDIKKPPIGKVPPEVLLEMLKTATRNRPKTE